MEDNDEDRISLGISDEEDEEDGEDFDSREKVKRPWHRPEARSAKPLEASDHDDEEISPSPPKRSRDQVSDMSGELEAQDQEEGEIFSDDNSADEKSDGGGNVATRDHSPPDSYIVHEEMTTSNKGFDDRGDQIDSPIAEEKNENLDLEVSLSQENQDDSLFDYGSKDIEDMKDPDTSPADKLDVDNTSIQRVRRYSSSDSYRSDSSVEKGSGDMGQSRMDNKEIQETDSSAAQRMREVVNWESSASESSDDYKHESRTADVAPEIAFSQGNERLFEQREHPTTYQEVELTTGERLFRPRKVKEKDDSDGKPVLDNSDDDYGDPTTIDHLEITVPQRTASKERKIKVQKKNEGSRSEAGQLVEDISDEDMQHEDVYANDRPRKMGLEGSGKTGQDQRSGKQGTSPSDSTKNSRRRDRDQDYKDGKKRIEGQREGRQNYQSELSQYGQGKKRSRDDEQEIDKMKRYDRHGSEREYNKPRSHFDRDPQAERSLSKGDYEEERISERQRSKSSIQMKSQIHVYSEVSLRVESNEDDLRTKLLKKQEAKHHYDRSESKGDYARTQKSEKKVDIKEGNQDIGSVKEKLSKKHSKERKAKKRSKYKEEKDLKKKRKHTGSKMKATAKEVKKAKDARGGERPKQRSEKERVSLKAKDTEGYGESSSDSAAYSEPESHHSSDENDLLDDNIAIDEDIQLRKTGSESGNEQEYDDISSADTDSPVPSPVELKKPPYFPAIQGCRSVEEFSWLNRIEEGTYGVVYRARDKRTDDIVALKRLKMEKEKEGFPITSLREINTLLKAQHPNIVTVREIVVGSNMDKIYIVMDYVAHDLKSLMEVMTQPFLVGEVKTLMIQLLRGVQHLHDNWILHRDIKTSNLLLSHNGILKIGDFGLAREYGSPLKLYTPIVVTLWYRAPELLLGMKEYSTAIDVWSVGCVFAELLMMKPLFPGKSEIDQLNRIFKELGTPNDKIWPGPPPFSELPMVKKTSFADHPYNVLRQRFGATLTDKGFNLLNRFLTYDPKKRITSDEGLKNEYFKESPLPVDPAMFPTWPAKSEGHKVARKHNASPKPPEGGQYAQQMADDDPSLFGFHMPAPVKGVASKGPGFSLKF